MVSKSYSIVPNLANGSTGTGLDWIKLLKELAEIQDLLGTIWVRILRVV